jgi:hypothetical protein
MEKPFKILRPDGNPSLLEVAAARVFDGLHDRDDRISEQLADLAAQTKRNTAVANQLKLQVKGLKEDVLDLKTTSHKVCALLEDLCEALKARCEKS